MEKQGLQLTFATLLIVQHRWMMENRVYKTGSRCSEIAFQAIPVDQQMSILADIEKQLHRTLHHNGKWFADYRRIQ